MEMEEKPLKFINAKQQDKIFLIDRPWRKERRRIHISFKTEICVGIGSGETIAFAARKTKIFRLQKEQEKNGCFVFTNFDSGIVVGRETFGFWMVFVRFDNDDQRYLAVSCDRSENLEELRLPKQFSGCIKTAMRFNTSVKKLTPPRLQLALAHY